MNGQLHRVVIVGGGFGGLHAARHLKRVPVSVTLIDKRNFHLFQPLLYQVATGGLSPANIAAPLRNVLSRQKNTQVWMADAVDIDVASRTVILADGEAPYDTLIVAAGAGNSYFGHDDWAPKAPGLKTLEDATVIRQRILGAFEAAEREPDQKTREAMMTLVVIGGGPTGVEMAGAIAEIARYTLRREFRRIDPALARTILIEAGERVLPTYPPILSTKAVACLGRLGVSVRTRSRVSDIQSDYVRVQGPSGEETIPTRTVIWAAGVSVSPLCAAIAKRTGAATDRAGRLVMGPDLTLPGHPEVFVIGDMAHVADGAGNPLPGIAPVAIQQGKYVANTIAARLRGRRIDPFRYRNHGYMATIGRAAAVAHILRFKFNGFFAWLAWLFIHLMYLVEFENRVLVLLQWAWSYFTMDRSARLITWVGGERGGNPR